MGKFLGTVKTSIKESIIWKFEMAMSVFFAPLSLIVMYFLWQAIYTNTGTTVIQGFTFNELITYYTLSWIVGIMIYTHIDEALRHEVRKGKVVKDLLKPINYVLSHFYITVGHRTYASIVEAIPILIIGFVFFNIQFNLASFPFFLVSLILAIFLNFLIAALVGLTAFWLVHNRGVMKLRRVLSYFLSGGMIPLTFFPLWFQNLSMFLPFQYLTFVPINMWLGKYSIQETLMLMAIHLVWVIALYIICALVWKAVMKKVAVVGI